MRKTTHIVVVTFGSESCRKAEDVGIKLAKKEKAILTFLYILDKDFLLDFLLGKPCSVEDIMNAKKELEKAGRLTLERAKEKARKKALTLRS